MTEHKTDATFHPGQAPVSWPQTVADHGAPPVAETNSERPWASPGAPPWAGQPTPKPKRKTPVVAVVLLVLGLLLCGGVGVALLAVAGSGEPTPGFTTLPGEDGEAAVTDPPSASEAPATIALGKAFKSGDFQYTVHKVKTGVTKVGGQFSEHKAQGVFTRLEVTVKNVGKSPAYFDADNRVKVEDATGRQFSADTSAAIYGNPDEDGWFTEINPGNAIKAYVFFDLPKDVKAERAVISPGMLTFEADAVVPLR